MPRIKAITASGAAGRQFLLDTLAAIEGDGYAREGAGENPDWTSLISAGRTDSLFGGKKVILVEGAEGLGPFPEELEEFLEDEGADHTILLVYESAPTKLFGAGARRRVEFLKADTSSIPPWERKRWLMSMARELKVRLSDEGTAILADMLDDRGELRSEVEKLGEYAGEGEVTGDMVKALSFDEGRSRLLSFLDGFCQGRPGEVFASLEYLKKDDSVLPLITALYNRIRPALYLGLFPQMGGDWVKLVLKIKDYPLRMSREALRRYPPKAIGELAAGLLALSWKEKTGAAEGWFGFEALLARCMEEGDQ